ncbi:MAG: sulfotransferase [Halioglobus sp.]
MKNRRLRPQKLSPAEQQSYDQAGKMLAAGQLEAAGERCRELLQSKPRALEPLRLLSWIDMRSGNIFAAHEAAEATVKLAPTDAMVVAWAAEVAAEVGNLRLARDHRRQVDLLGSRDSAVFSSVATSLTASEDHAGALVYYQRLLKKYPDDKQAKLNVAYSARYAGDFELAETCLRQLVSSHPDFYQAYFALTQLGTVSAEKNHISQLESALQRSGGCTEAEAFLGYGLGKEYEDLGENALAFQHYEMGARGQRKLYPRPSREAEIARSVIAASDGDGPVNDSQVGKGLVFVVGLPRAGSTLVDRMLGAHSKVYNAGELRALPFCAHRQLQLQPAEVMSPGLLAALGEIDVRSLALAYLDCLPEAWRRGETVTDKNPLNYLYVGLIRRALPAAKILHIYRSPMDACFSNYKQLFASGAYRHSYDLDEVAQHYAAYLALMGHWRELYGDSLVELSYELLVADTESELRRVLPALGLDWEDSVLEFHRRKAAVGTASFAQVRQPVYTGSVERWRLFAEPLKPLADALQRAGVSL